MEYNELVRQAHQARKNAYAPYSGFCVGAALLAKNGEVYLGCNIENAAYTPTNCAERTAFFKAVSDGVYDFEAIAIVGGHKDAQTLDLCAPCGVCRQVMAEFCQKDFKIVLSTSENEITVYKFNEILPLSFGPENLK